MKIAPPINSWIAVFDVPHSIALSPGARRQIELFLSVAVVVGGLSLIGGVSTLLRDGLTLGAILMLVIAVIMLGAYLLGRTLYYLAAIVLASVTLNLSPFVYLGLSHLLPPAENFDTADILGTLAWLGPSLLLAGILLPLRWLLTLGGGVSVLAAAVPTLITRGNLLAGLAAFALAGTLVLLIAITRVHTQGLERIHTEELTEARDRLEEHVRERTAHLEQLNTELQDARRALQSAFQSRSQYLAEISHDLRAPLTVILGYSEMLSYRAAEQSDPDLARQVRSLETAARYLTALSRHMIDLAALERGDLQFHIQPVSLPELYEELRNLVQPLADRNHNAFESSLADGIKTIQTDPLRLQQVLVNLLDNAAKFTENGTIRLEIARRARADGAHWIVFTVSDTGIGIAPAQLKALFQPFPPSYRAPRDRYSGAGLGLTITRLLCNRLGGSIEVESQPGRGSTFTIRMPETTASL